MPKWVIDQLISKGYLTEQGLTRKAKVMTHRPCRQPTISGLDADVCAFDAWCDVIPLNAKGEVEALLDGRATYELYGGRLYPRDRWAIPGNPPSSRVLVLAEHRCGHPIPSHWRQPPKPTVRPTEGVMF